MERGSGPGILGRGAVGTTRRRRGRFTYVRSVILAAACLGGAGLGSERPLPGQEPVADVPSPTLADLIRLRVEGGQTVGAVPAAGRPAYAVDALPPFYTRRGFEPVWVKDARLRPEARELVRAIRDSEKDGLRPGDYHLAEIEARIEGPGGGRGDLRSDLELELLLSDAFLVLGSHLLHGRVDPVTIHPEWTANRREADLALLLEEALAPGGPGVVAALDAQRPGEPEYGALRDALVRLRAVARDGGWGAVPVGRTLEPGTSDSAVVDLRRRLRVGGDLPADHAAPDSLLFDDALADAVRRFQGRHGLAEDGVVGPRTLEALNTPVEDRIRQLVVALERWRWMPETLGERHIRVNIAAFRTRVFEAGTPVLELRSIVGRQYRQTPVFSSSVTYMVFAPFWHVPPNIAAVDKLPEIRRDPGYVAAQNMVMLEAASGAAVDPRGVDWSGVSGAEFNRRFRLRQSPGPWNALGKVKFMFPNRWNVYLHDTPSRELFIRDQRDFSSGCIRVERPAELARYLLGGDLSWSTERISNAMEGRSERSVSLPEPVPIHILYWTAFVDPDGRVSFRPDIYGRDARVAAALAEAPPGD